MLPEEPKEICDRYDRVLKHAEKEVKDSLKGSSYREFVDVGPIEIVDNRIRLFYRFGLTVHAILEMSLKKFCHNLTQEKKHVCNNS